MPQHRLLIGDGAGHYLPFARNHLRDLRKHMSIHAYSNTVRTEGASIHVRWNGDQEHIRIDVSVEDYATWGVASGIHFKIPTPAEVPPKHPFLRRGPLFSEASPDVRGLFNIGGHFGAYLAFDPPPAVAGFHPAKLFLTPDWGVSAEAKFTFNTQVTGTAPNLSARLGFVYAGVTRDMDGVVTGKRVVIRSRDVGPDFATRYHVSENTGEDFTSFLFPLPSGETTPAFVSPSTMYFVGNKVVLVYVTNTRGGAPFKEDVVLISTDGGLTFGPTTGDLTTYLSTAPVFTSSAKQDIQPFQFFPIGNDKVVAINGGGTSGPWLSVNGGLTFDTEQPARPTALIGFSETIIVLGEDALWLMVQGAATGKAFCFRSTDAAATWLSVAAPLADVLFRNLGIPRTFRGSKLATMTAPATPASILIPVYEAPNWHAYISEDSGDTWTQAGLLTADAPARVYGENFDGVFDDFQDIHRLGAFRRPAPAFPALPTLYANPL